MSLNDQSGTTWCKFTSLLLANLKDWVMERLSGVSKSLFEVLVTIFFTFIPFFFLSIRWLKVEGANTPNSISDTFFGYWQAGEIVLPVLGLCGAVAALLALNVGYFAWWIHALVGAVILVFTIACGAALTETDGFKETLNPELIAVGFLGYAILAFVWFLLAAKVRTTEAEPRKSDSNALSLLEVAKARRGKQEVSK